MTDARETRPTYVPQFEVTTLAGRRVRYQDVWQRRNLILVLADPSARDAAAQYETRLQARRQELEEANAVVIVTDDAIPPWTAPQVLVADQWGEVLYAEAPSSGEVSSYPSVDELMSWVQFIRMQCPECPP